MVLRRTQQQLDMFAPPPSPPRAKIQRHSLTLPDPIDKRSTAKTTSAKFDEGVTARVKIKRHTLPNTPPRLCEDGCGRYTRWNEERQYWEPFILYPHGPAYDTPPTLPRWEAPNDALESIQRIWNLGRNIHEHHYLVGMELIWLKKVFRRTFGSWVNANMWFGERQARKMMGYARECNKARKLVETVQRKWRPKTAQYAVLALNICNQRPAFSDLCDFPNAFEAETPIKKIHAIASEWMQTNKECHRERRAFAVKFQDLATQLMEMTTDDYKILTTSSTSVFITELERALSFQGSLTPYKEPEPVPEPVVAVKKKIEHQVPGVETKKMIKL